MRAAKPGFDYNGKDICTPILRRLSIDGEQRQRHGGALFSFKTQPRTHQRISSASTVSHNNQRISLFAGVENVLLSPILFL